MSKNIECNHFKLLENINKSMKNFIVQTSSKSGPEIGKGSLGGDLATNACISAIGPASIFIPEDLKESVHILMLVNIPEQLKQEKRRWVIGWRAFNAVTRSSQRPDKGKIN